MQINYELNQELLDACLKEAPDYLEIGKLLEKGAKPLGPIKSASGSCEIVYCNIVDQYIDPSFNSEAFPKITELFLKYGMDVSKPDVAYEECDDTNPLWMFAFHSGENTLKTLRLLLDYGLDADSAGKCWSHILFDYYNVWGSLEDEFCYEMLYHAIRIIMLIASYPHVLQSDVELQKVIWLAHNDYPVEAFRNWADFAFEIDTSYWHDETPQVYKSVVTILEKRTEKKVWKFGFGLQPENIV